MASVTQLVPTLTGGVSQQPDELKVPGQVNVANNVLPDVTHGLLKRPGGKLITSLSDGTNNSVSNGRWFHYYRDEDEQYIGQVSRTGDINMWKCSDGSEMTVNYTAGKIAHISIDNEGTGYSSAPTISISGGGGSNATATATVSGGKITAVTITNGGTGYTSFPTVTVSGGGGSNAVLTAYTELHFYLKHGNDEDVQTLTINDFTFLTNRTKTVAMADTIEALRPPEVFIELKNIKYASQYSLNLFSNNNTTPISTATRITVDLVRSSNNYCNTDGTIASHLARVNNSTRCQTVNSSGDPTFNVNNDEQAPNVATRIFDISSGQTLVDTNAISTDGSSDFSYQANIYGKLYGGTYTQSGTTVTVSSNGHVLNTGDEVFFDFLAGAGVDTTKTITKIDANTFSFTADASATQSSAANVNYALNNVQGRSDLYFRITTTGQSTPVGSGSNVEYRTRYNTTNDLLYGGQGWQQGDHFYVYMKDAYYEVTIDEVSTSNVQANLGLIRPTPTAFDTKTTVTAESILGALRTEIVATGNFNAVEQIGNGLYISRTSNVVNGVEQNFFNASTPVSELLNVVAGEVLTVDDLPRQSKHGFVVKVANSANEEDDYYLKFLANNGLSGEGVWEECVRPGDKTNFDAATMPIQLVRTNSTTFTLSQVDWEGAQVGSTVVGGTNPQASFVTKTINKMVFFRNRLVMLSDENVIMSRPGNFFNFWAKTAQTFSNVDPIDLSCSSTYPAIVFDAIQVNTGLVIFTKNQQFMLTKDSDVLNPNTAKINRLSSYNFNFKTNPVNLGTTIGFLDNANKYSRFFEMANIRREGEPEVVEQSKVVSQFFEKDLKIISNSRENGLILFSEENTSTLYGYRYFTSGNERILQAWFQWTLTGTIQYHCMLDDALYVVVRNNSKDQLLKYSIKLDDNGHFVTAGEDYPIHLDHCKSVTTGGGTYSSTTNKTTFPKPTGFESSNDIAAYDIDSGTNLGRFAEVTINGSNLEISGNWSGETFLIGYQFEMQVELPKIFFTYQAGSATRKDTRSDLIIHRVKFNFGKVGLYQMEVDRVGVNKPLFIQEVESTIADAYTANNVGFVPDLQGVVPCYERNNNLVITVKSKHPSPATIVSYQWEGKYTNNNYTRV